jgi:hypothetical protein
MVPAAAALTQVRRHSLLKATAMRSRKSPEATPERMPDMQTAASPPGPAT